MQIKFIVSIILLMLSQQVLADEIIIGIDADMSASAAVGGEAIYRGAKIAVDEINDQGGVLGKKLSLMVKDHRGNPRRGVENIQSLLKNDNLLAVLGGVHTPVALNEVDIVHKNKLIFLSPWAAGTPLVDNGFQPNYIFRLSVRDQDAGEVLIKHAKKRGFQRVGLLLERTGWGKSNNRSLVAAAKKYGVDIELIKIFNWGSKDFSRQIQAFKEANVQTIIFVGNAPEGSVFARNMAKLALSKQLPIISHWGIASGTFVDTVGLDQLASLDITVLQTYSFIKPKNVRKANYVIGKYREYFKRDATVENIPAVTGVVHSYDLIHLLSKAIIAANTTQREKVRDALEEIENYDGLVRYFKRPFTKEKHDALTVDDYILSKFNKRGFLIPIPQ